VVRFHAIGDAPILRQPVFKISSFQKFGMVAQFLRKELGLTGSTPGQPSNSNLFLYINQAFAPAPDEIVGNLHASFHAPEGHLIVHYSLSNAWG
jgi:ubiquitin-like protein ATG12